MIDFYIRINVRLSGDKAADSCLLVLGEQTPAWKQVIRTELKADKKQLLTGLASLSKDGKTLQLQIEAGSAKKSLVRKGLKALCNKAGLKLSFVGGEPDPEDKEEEVSDEKTSDQSPKANATAVQTARLLAQAGDLHGKAARLSAPNTPAPTKVQLAKELKTEIPAFLAAVGLQPNPPAQIAEFAAKMQILLPQAERLAEESELIVAFKKLDEWAGSAPKV